MRDQGVVRQTLDMSCGAAALATLLRFDYGERTDEATIIDIVGLRSAYAFTDLAYAAEELGYRTLSVRMGFSTLQALKLPVLLFLNVNGARHFVVFRGTDGAIVRVADPAWGDRRLFLSQFLRMWRTGRDRSLPGQALVILHNTRNDTRHGGDAWFGGTATSRLLPPGRVGLRLRDP